MQVKMYELGKKTPKTGGKKKGKREKRVGRRQLLSRRSGAYVKRTFNFKTTKSGGSWWDSLPARRHARW